MDLMTFNTAPQREASDVVRSCADVAAWVDAVVGARPYASIDALLDRATELTGTWGGAELDEALADHPRIGERHVGQGRSAEMSRREQSATATLDTDQREQLAQMNATYEQRFGRIYLVRAADRDADELMALLQERLQNSPERETDVAVGQLVEIALRRLAGAVA